MLFIAYIKKLIEHTLLLNFHLNKTGHGMLDQAYHVAISAMEERLHSVAIGS